MLRCIHVPGLPLLLLFALVSTVVSFWMDKLFFLRYSKTPIAYNAGLARRATSLIPVAIFLHIGFAIWMLGNTNIVADEALEAALIRATEDAGNSGSFVKSQIDTFDPGLNISSRLFANHVLLLSALLILIIIYFLLSTVVRRGPRLLCVWLGFVLFLLVPFWPTACHASFHMCVVWCHNAACYCCCCSCSGR